MSHLFINLSLSPYETRRVASRHSSVSQSLSHVLYPYSIRQSFRLSVSPYAIPPPVDQCRSTPFIHHPFSSISPPSPLPSVLPSPLSTPPLLALTLSPTPLLSPPLPPSPARLCSAEGGGGNTEEGEKTGSSSRKRYGKGKKGEGFLELSRLLKPGAQGNFLIPHAPSPPNTHRFLELSRSLEPGKAPKADKASILCDAVRVLSQLHCPSHTPFPPTHRFLELSRLLKPGAQGNFLIPHAPSPPNTHRFLELSRSLEPGKAPKADKASILCDAVRVLSQLRAEREALKESNAALQEQIKELKVKGVGGEGGAEKHELREEKARLKAESEKLQQHVNGSSAAAAAAAAAAATSTHPATPTTAIPVATIPLHHSPPTAPATPMAYQPHPHAAAMHAAAAAYAAQMQQCQQMALGTPKGAHMGGMPTPMSAPMQPPMAAPMTAAAVSHAVSHPVGQPVPQPMHQPGVFAGGPPPMAMWQWMAPTSVDTSQDHMLRPPVA
ncbi:unnamed protein product [Closterium sp. NIES-53]